VARATGELTQNPIPAGCVSETGAGGVDGTALTGGNGVAASPDGENV
jgi:hypothetical protein